MNRALQNTRTFQVQILLIILSLRNCGTCLSTHADLANLSM